MISSNSSNPNQPVAGGKLHRLWLYVPRFLRNDFWRKMIAFCFAILLYFTISSRLGSEERISNIPLELDLPGDLVNMDKSNIFVTLTVKGSKKALAEATTSNIKVKAVVQRSNYTGMPYVLRLTNDNVKTPMGISVVSISPKDVVLDLEQLVDKKVSLTARYDSLDKLPRDYSIVGVRFTPMEVWVRGAKSIVDEIESVSTLPIPLDRQIMDSFEYSVGLASPEGVRVRPEKVTAYIEISKQFIDKTFKSLPLKVIMPPNLPGNMSVELQSSSHVEVTLNGPKGQLLLLKPEAIQPYIDLSNLRAEGSYTVDVGCFVNNETQMKIKNIYPPKIQLKLVPRSK